MKKLIVLMAMIASQMSYAMMTDEQFDRMAEAYQKQLESERQENFKIMTCLNGNILKELNSNVLEVRVKSFRSRGIVENIIGNIFGNDVSNWRVSFALVLKNKVVDVNCGIWTKGKNTDLVNHCTRESDGVKLNITKYHSSITSMHDWFVIEKGCLVD